MSQLLGRVRGVFSLLIALGAACALSAQEPDILHFTMDEGAGSTIANSANPGRGDASVTVQGSPTWDTPGAIGSSALNLMGSGYFDTGWTMDLGPGDSWTLEMRFRSNVVNDGALQYLFADDGAGWGAYIGDDAYGGLVVYGQEFLGGGFAAEMPLANIRDGNWHHLAIVYDQSSPSLTIYVDGAVQWTAQIVVEADAGNGSLYFGGSNDGGTGLNDNPDGAIDEIRMWGVAFSSAQLSAANRTMPLSNGLNASAGFAPSNFSAVAGGVTDRQVASFALYASGNDEDVASITVTKTGNLSDASISAVRLWNDANLNGVLDGGESQIGGDQTFSSGTATFADAPLVGILDGNGASVIVTYSLTAGATAGSTFGASLSVAGSVSTSNGPVVGSFPLSGPSYRVRERINTLPYTLNFDGSLPNNISVATAAGNYPTAAATFAVPASIATSEDGRGALTTGQYRAIPPSAPNAFAMDAPMGDGVAALDLYFNLGIYDANTQSIELSYWENVIDSQDSSFDNVFISTDGGQTWAVSALKLDTPSGRFWRSRTVDLSAAVVAAGTNFTATTVVRIQNWEDDYLQEGVLIDNISVREVSAGLEITSSAPTTLGNVRNNESYVWTQTLDMRAHSADQNLTDITLTKLGTLDDAEIVGVSLWADDGDFTFNPSDETLLDMQSFSAGSLTFSGAPLISLTAPNLTRYYITMALSGTAPAGATVGSEITAGSDITLGSLGPNNGTFPLTGSTWTVLTPAASFPWSEDFEGALSSNLRFHYLAGEDSLRGSDVGATTAPTTNGNPGRVRIGGTFSRSAPSQGTNQLALDAPGGRNATTGMEINLDLSNQDANLDIVTLTFDWNEEGRSNNQREGLFLSFDGGASFPWKVWHPGSGNMTPYNSYTSESIDLSQAVLDAATGLAMPGLNFTSTMVLRFQGFDSGDLQSEEGMLFDNFNIELSPRLDLQRPASTSIAAGGTDAAGASFLTGVQSMLEYTLANLGSGTLNLDNPAVSVANESNVVVTITQPISTSLGENGTDTFTINLTPDADGAFSFDLTIASDDVNNPMYTITVTGTSTSYTEITVFDGSSTEVADAAMVDLGDLGQNIAASYTWTVENSGNIALNFTGVDPDFVAVANAVDCAVSVTTQIPSMLAGGASTTFSFDVTPSGLTAFSFDLVIASDDADESNYTISFSGMGIIAASDIDVQFPAGTSLTAGSTHAIGDWQASSQFMLTYTVANVGNLPLMLTGAPVVQISSMNNCAAAVDTTPATSLAAGETSSLIFTVTPSAAGVFSFDFYIPSDDANENPYLIRVAGNAVAAPAEINVSRDGTSTADGGSDDLGDLTEGVTITRTWTITNQGSSGLSLTGTPVVAVSGEANCTATVSVAPSTTLIAGEATTFTVEITPTVAELPFAFDLSIDSTDADEATYNYTVFGNTIAASGDDDDDMKKNHSCAIGGSSSQIWLMLMLGLGSLAVVMRRRDA